MVSLLKLMLLLRRAACLRTEGAKIAVGPASLPQVKTTFIAVCIAEHLSVAETKRLLVDLEKNAVSSSHLVVNQMVHCLYIKA